LFSADNRAEFSRQRNLTSWAEEAGAGVEFARR
jgi:hypothetical protein